MIIFIMNQVHYLVATNGSLENIYPCFRFLCINNMWVGGLEGGREGGRETGREREGEGEGEGGGREREGRGREEGGERERSNHTMRYKSRMPILLQLAY